METAARLPLPQLSRGRFVFSDGEVEPAFAYTDEALFDACGVRVAFTERVGSAELIAWAGSENSKAIMPHQVHGVHVAFPIDGSAAAIDACREEAQEGADAIVMPYADVPVVLRFADCLPLILVAPNGTFSVVHCGWRGTVGHIAAYAAEALAQQAGCELGECNAYIGPFIHAECFEVSEEIADRFVAEFGEVSVASYRHVDLGAAVRTDLLRSGFSPERVTDLDMCTVCNVDTVFSYRAENGTTGRHCAFCVRRAPKGDCKKPKGDCPLL